MSKIEIERRWLLSKCPPLSFFNPSGYKIEQLKLKQYYLGPSERVRMTASPDGEFLFEHFKKEWLGDSSSLEEVTVLDNERFQELVKTQAKSKITKTRMRVESLHNPFVYEFDHITRKDKANVNILEVEFESKGHADIFVLPWIFNEFVIAEITNLREFSNYSLSEAI